MDSMEDIRKTRCEICCSTEAVLSNTIFVAGWTTPHNIDICYTCHNLCEDSPTDYYGIHIPGYIPKEQVIRYLTQKVAKKKKERLSQNKG